MGDAEGKSKHPKRISNPDATCPRHTDKDFRVLIENAWSAGWWCETRRNNYIMCYPPDGGAFIKVPSTPSSNRTIKNIRARFKRGGLDV